MAAWSTPRRCRNRSLDPRTRCFMSPLRRDTYQRPGGAALHNASRLARLVLCAALLASVSDTLSAFTVTIAAAAPKTVYLQVGVGGFTGYYNAGGTPGNNATVNKNSVTVAAAAVGNGTPQAMTTDSTVGAIAQNQWAESCWTFSYNNTTLPAAGTYTGRVLYTLTAP